MAQRENHLTTPGGRRSCEVRGLAAFVRGRQRPPTADKTTGAQRPIIYIMLRDGPENWPVLAGFRLSSRWQVRTCQSRTTKILRPRASRQACVLGQASDYLSGSRRSSSEISRTWLPPFFCGGAAPGLAGGFLPARRSRLARMSSGAGRLPAGTGPGFGCAALG